MSDQSITSLIEKLEGAEVGSRELDLAIGQTLGLIDVHENFIAPDGSRSGRGNCDPWPAWTQSLDRAEGLAHRVLPGWWWTAGRCGLTCHASVGPDSKFIAEPALSKFDGGFHADIPNPTTPALALCAAILRAQSEARV